jgi:hypothetical protein
MGPNRRHASGPFPRPASCLPLTLALSAYAPKAISRVNEDKWGEHGRRCCNRIPINGWAPFLVQETATTETNCDKRSKLSRPLSLFKWLSPARMDPLNGPVARGRMDLPDPIFCCNLMARYAVQLAIP